MAARHKRHRISSWTSAAKGRKIMSACVAARVLVTPRGELRIGISLQVQVLAHHCAVTATQVTEILLDARHEPVPAVPQGCR